LRDRAGRPDWPELSEYDCYACHHPVQAESWRRTARAKPGAPLPARWYTALLPDVAKGAPALGPLTTALTSRYPDPKGVIRAAKEASEGLEGLARKLEKEQLAPGALAELRERLLRRLDRKGAPADWDELEQVALALAAVDAAEGQPRKATGRLL